MPDSKSKKKNVPKFLLAKNQAAAPGKTYIVHTQEPPFIAEIIRFSSIQERDVYVADNPDKEFIDITQLVLIEMKKFFEVFDREKDRAFLAKRLKHWTVANYLRRNALFEDD